MLQRAYTNVNNIPEHNKYKYSSITFMLLLQIVCHILYTMFLFYFFVCSFCYISFHPVEQHTNKPSFLFHWKLRERASSRALHRSCWKGVRRTLSIGRNNRNEWNVRIKRNQRKNEKLKEWKENILCAHRTRRCDNTSYVCYNKSK